MYPPAIKLQCEICKRTHRVQHHRVAGGRWVVVCFSCRAAMLHLNNWQRANPHVDISELTRVFAQCVLKPAAGVVLPARDKSA